jgi:aspartate kinase
MLVMKFGGTSVGNPAAIQRVVKIVDSRVRRKPIVVVSAVSKTTDELVTFCDVALRKDTNRIRDLIAWTIQKHSRIIDDLQAAGRDEVRKRIWEVGQELEGLAGKFAKEPERWSQWMDEALRCGEFLSSHILVNALRDAGIDAVWVDARNLLLTDSRFGRARPSADGSRRQVERTLLPLAEAGRVPVTQGFIGADRAGRTTTLGRGGSDYSATFLASLINASAVEVWTDVDGVMTADPSLLPDAMRIKMMTFEEASELAYFGAKVLHPETILPAIEGGIPVFVLNSMRPDESGTEICPSSEHDQERPGIVKSIAYKEGLSVLGIRSTRMLMAYGFLSSIFEVFNRFETAVDLVSTSEVSVSITIDNLDRIDEIMRELREFAEVEVRHKKAIVCVVGENLCREPGMTARIFGELEGIEVTSISQGASSSNISFVIDEADIPEVIGRIHRRFFSPPFDRKLFSSHAATGD